MKRLPNGSHRFFHPAHPTNRCFPRDIRLCDMLPTFREKFVDFLVVVASQANQLASRRKAVVKDRDLAMHAMRGALERSSSPLFLLDNTQLFENTRMDAFHCLGQKTNIETNQQGLLAGQHFSTVCRAL